MAAMCSSEKYALVTDFAWYIDILVILARTKGIDGHGKHSRNLGPLVSNQIIDVTLRVLPVRPYAIRRMIGLILDGGTCNDKGHFSGTFGLESNVSMMPEVLPVAAFIIGEYSSLIDEAISLEIDGEEEDDELLKYNSFSKGTYHAIIQTETDPSNVDSHSLQTQSIYAQATMKVYAAATCSKRCTDHELEACTNTLAKHLPVYMQSMDTEVQERAFTSFQLLISLDLIEDPVTPPLQSIDSESDVEALSAKEGTPNSTDDLLKLGTGSGNQTKESFTTKVLSDFPLTTSTSGSLATRARAVSDTLKYLFIPEHMKPISSKAQRKKKASAPPHIKAILDNENTAIFSKLFNEGNLRQGRSPRSIESVTFNSQHQAIGVTSIRNSSVSFNKKLDDPFLADLNGSNANVASQNTTNDATTSLNAKHHDPFILNSQSTLDVVESKSFNRFGAIQLDSGCNGSDTGKKKKRKKKNKKQAKDSADLEFLAGMGSMTNNDDAANMIFSRSHQSIIDSDEDDELNEPALAIARNNYKQGPSLKLNGLANIDLTTPLREDEFIPEPKHYVVPNPQSMPAVDERLQSSKRKKGKKSKTSKKSKAANKKEFPATELLDFGGFGTSNNIDVPSSDTAKPTNAINNAFDDLLSLNAPSSLPVPPTLPVSSENKPNQSKRAPTMKIVNFWQQATLKNASSATSFNWDDVLVMYQTHPSKKNLVTLSIKVCNKSSVNTLPNAVITLPEVDTLNLIELGPQDDMDLGKVGPFSISSLDLKGTISVGHHNAQMKVTIPCSTTMSPISLSQDEAILMMNSDEWSSYSSKVQIRSQIDPGTLKSSLMAFLSVSEVGDEMDNSNFMLSAKSTNGAIVLLLVKATKNGLKIDVKSKDKKTAKTLSSDLKKIIM